MPKTRWRGERRTPARAEEPFWKFSVSPLAPRIADEQSRHPPVFEFHTRCQSLRELGIKDLCDGPLETTLGLDHHAAKSMIIDLRMRLSTANPIEWPNVAIYSLVAIIPELFSTSVRAT